MKPLILKLQAFGPYAGREIVDFRPALDSGLFGIYGATGSGKSSIFSAMTFALFGEAAKSDQLATTLRSHHADAGTVTEVELIFEVGGRRLRIVRRPEQMRAARRGGGETRDPHKAWLFDVGGLDLDAVGEQNPGKILAEGKLATVENAVVAALGYGAEQFRQIVLLPQGKFETFLTADTKDRLAILRDLFDVSLYRRLTDSLKDKARVAEEHIRIARDVCRGRLASEGFDGSAALEAGIADAIEKQSALTETAYTARHRLDAAEQALQAALRCEESFQAHEAAKAELTRLDEAAPRIAAMSARLSGARIAHALADANAAATSAVAAARSAAAKLQDAVTAHATATQSQEEATQALQALMEQREAIDKDRTALLSLRHYGQALAGAAELRRQTEETEAQTHKAQAARTKAEARYLLLVDEHKIGQHALEDGRKVETMRADLRARISETRSAFASAEAYEKATAQLTAVRAELRLRREQQQAAAHSRAAAEVAYRAAETALASDHTVTIARGLAPGAACPVCGSEHHPAPARGSPDIELRTKALHKAKAAFDIAERALSEAAGLHALAEQRCRDREDTLATLLTPERAADELAKDLAALERRMAALGAVRDLDALSSACRSAEQSMTAALSAFEAARQAAAAQELQAAKARIALDEALRPVPQALRAAEKVESEIDAVVQRIGSWDREVAKAQSSVQSARETTAARLRDRENAETHLQDCDASARAAEAAFAARLESHGLSHAAYLVHSEDIPQIETLSAEIDAHRRHRERIEAEIRVTTERIHGVERPDLTAFKLSRDQAECDHRAAAENALAIAHRRNHLETLKSEIGAELARLDALEADTATVRTLADACAGKLGPKVDLETFAIGAMFDRVLEAANQRLAPMTRGRYGLVRETQSSGQGRQGLGIAIDDAHTGRQRPATTLSGGETFIAALALALGLSEVVESERGSVSLDTIFIDEGFGSLDSENDAGTLEQVLQTLQDLVGRNRAVGLISHVPLVQQTIPNGFLITASPSGSRIETRA